jgi:polyhydroxybutyrate depolymerase
MMSLTATGTLRAGLRGLLCAAAALIVTAQVSADQNLATEAVGGPTISLSTNGLAFQAGDVHVLSGAASSPVAMAVDIYVAAQAPDGGTTYYLVPTEPLSLVPWIAPLHAGVSLPAGFDVPSQPIFSGQMPALPQGAYTWYAAFTAAGTGTVVSNLAKVQWAYGPLTYAAENRSITSGGVSRTFVLSRPNVNTAGLPLVISLHGDGGTGNSIRQGLPIENRFLAVYAYPDAPDGTFEYYTTGGRAAEARFTRDLIAALEAELGIDSKRVFVTGMSGGATLANALGCYLGPDVIRGLGIHSGTLYPIDDDFTYTANGGVSCALPATRFIWGTADVGEGTSYAEGQDVRDNHLATQDCGPATTPALPAPCAAYTACGRAVHWCAIGGLGHSIWSEAGAAFAAFFTLVP